MPVNETIVGVAGAKAGVSVGLFATAVIFTDPAFMWMAVVGSIMGVGSAVHTIFEVKEVKFTKHQIVAVLIKSFLLGVVSMPILFLGIQEGLFYKILNIEHSDLSTSLSVAISFAGSWYFTPVLDSIVNRFRSQNNE